MVKIEKNEMIILSGCVIINDNQEVLLLFRKDHQYYETPGGKVRPNECSNPENPTLKDLANTAEREVYEELGNNIKLDQLSYFGKVKFIIPDGRRAIANKFLTKILSGTPRLNEPDTFSRLEYLPLRRLEKYPLSPDLKLLLNNLKKHFKIK